MTRRSNQIYGMTMYPCSSSLEENEKTWKGSSFYTDKEFMESYRSHLIAMQHIAVCAKIYVEKKWKDVKDWSNLNITISYNSDTETEYYNHIPKIRNNSESNKSKHSDAFDKILSRIDKEDALKHNPIVNITDVVLDPTDGDFSLTINGKDHLWIDDESIIIIADYIEGQLKLIEVK
jgi:hypothetical protein